MDPFKLTGTTPDGKQGSVWGCGACMRTCMDEPDAVHCCAPYRCDTCGAETPRYHLRCDACRIVEQDERERAAADRAIKVPLADYDAEALVVVGDECMSVDDWLGMEDGEERPWAWATKRVPMPKLDAHDIVENALCDEVDGLDDAIDYVDVDGLQALLDAWREKQDLRWWVEDRTRVVVLGPVEDDDGE